MKVLIVVPVYNEEKIIRNNLSNLADFLRNNLNNYDDYLLVAVDNCSTDNSANLIKELAEKREKLFYFSVSQKGKGSAVIKAWQNFQNDFDIFCFMDADLATDLQSLPNLLKAIEENYDIAVGSRYLKDSQIKRSFIRKLFSFGYRLVIKMMIGTKIKDLPCGFKAVNQKIVKEILPNIKNQTWFFDTELIYLAEKQNFKIKEIPVKWFEPREQEDKSRVNLFGVSWLYFKELLRLKKDE